MSAQVPDGGVSAPLPDGGVSAPLLDDRATAPPPVAAGSDRRPRDDRSDFVDSVQERIMHGSRSLRRSDVASQAGVDPEEARELWRSLGFANTRDEDVVFTPADVDALQRVVRLIEDGVLTPTAIRGLARAFGRSTDRLATWQTQVISDQISGDQIGVDSDVARRAAELTAEVADALEPLLVYVWRRNLSQAVSRMVADSEPESQVGVRRTVGFADLVSFTQLVRHLSERDLARLVSRFETVASDIVSVHGGAVVKTIGDEILFTHQDDVAAAEIALDLVEAVSVDEVIPHLRVGLSQGRVLARQGDVYGDTVNRAARLTSAARPGRVLIDHDVAWSLSTDPRFRTEELAPIELPGIGILRPWSLTWAPRPHPFDEIKELA